MRVEALAWWTDILRAIPLPGNTGRWYRRRENAQSCDADVRGLDSDVRGRTCLRPGCLEGPGGARCCGRSSDLPERAACRSAGILGTNARTRTRQIAWRSTTTSPDE